MKYNYKFNDYMEIQDGKVRFWIEQDSSIHLKAIDLPSSDPVELTSKEARMIGNKLIEMANKLDSE